MRWISCARLVLAALVAAAELSGASNYAGSQAPAQPAPAGQAAPAKFVVVLDAAHGGDDNGGRLSESLLEKNFTLAFSVRLRSLLSARGLQVVTTREQDATVDVDRRAAIANHAGAQACLILHASEIGQGVHLYVSSLSSTEPARFAAWKTTQASWVTRSLALASVLNSALQHGGMPVIVGRMTLPPIDSMACPAVAVEIAPENAPGHGEGGGLDDPDYQARVAGALAAALLEWRTEARQP